MDGGSISEGEMEWASTKKQISGGPAKKDDSTYRDQCTESKAPTEGIPAFSPGGSRNSCPWIMGSPVVGNRTPFSFRWGSTSRRAPGLQGLLEGEEEGERIASSTRGGVLADDDASEGEGGNSDNSGSKFRNSVQ